MFLFLSSCQKPLEEGECLDLLDRYTDRVIEQSRPSTPRARRAELQKQARKKAQLDPEFARCARAVSRTQFECAMAAGTADQIERCLIPGPFSL